jgi:hypothetical protein
MSVARAMFAGPGACRALLDGACGEVELRISGGAYVRLGSSDWLLLTAPFGPLSVAIDGLHRDAHPHLAQPTCVAPNGANSRRREQGC